MNDKTYNGWANYETWLVKLWIDNERGDYEHWNERAREQWECPTDRPAYWSPSERAMFSLADEIKEAFDERSSELIPMACVYADLLRVALSEVRWDHVADAILESLELEGYESAERAHA